MDLLEILGSSVDISRLKLALKRGNLTERVGEVSYVFYDAISSLDIYLFNGEPCYFNGCFYDTISVPRFELLLYDSMRTLGVPPGDIVARGKRISSFCLQALSCKIFEVNRDLVCFKNCVFDIRSNSCLPFSPTHNVLGCLDYNYDESSYPKLWLKFLEEVLPDVGLRDIIQEFFGLIFADRRTVKIESMLFLLGGGSNGKSVIFDVLTGVLGQHNVSNFELSALTKGNESLKNIASINGKLVNYCSEISSNEISSSTAKSLISGEPRQARKLYGEPFVAYDIPLMIANANEMPYSKDATNGFFRRMLIIPFNVRIPAEKQDKLLSNKLSSEYAGIFNWIMRGLERIKANNYIFTESSLSTVELANYRDDSNPILRWIGDSGYSSEIRFPSVPDWVSSFDLYTREYVPYADRNKFPRYSIQYFGRIMKNVGFERRRLGGGYEYAIYKY